MIEITTPDQTAEYNISTRLLMLEALRKGYQLSFFPSMPSANSGITRAFKNGREFYFKSTCTVLTPSFGFFAAEDKVLTYSLLSSRGISTPTTRALSKDESVEELYPFLEANHMVVVKPADMNHGDGVTISIDTKEKLKKAVQFAREKGNHDSDVIVQQQVSGVEYRFLVVDGKVIAVAGRRPPFVVGDGHSTIKQLIEKKNQDPRRGLGHISELTLVDIEEVAYHRGKNFLKNVPEKGEEVDVLDTSNLSKGGESVDYTDIASPALKKLAVEAAQACFLGIAGVDIMTADITADNWDDSYVIEVNLTPGIRMHQFPSVGEKRDVAKVIFRAIEKHARPVDKKVIKIGRSEQIIIKNLHNAPLMARIDTGATLSSIWATNIHETDNGLEFCLLGPSHKDYSGEIVKVKDFSQRIIASSTGHTETRYVVKLTVKLKSKSITARFTLANRATQVYPVLIGRNILRNNFLVDVFGGKKDRVGERRKRGQLDKELRERS